MSMQTLSPSTETDEALEAREAVAARLERLARLVRNTPQTDVHVLDAAYHEVVTCASHLRDLLGPWRS